MTDKIQKPWWQSGVTVFAEVTGWIVLPIVIALYSGRYLDEKYNSYPWFFLGLTAIAFLISSVGIVRVAMKYIKQIEKEVKQKQPGDKIKVRKNSIIDNNESRSENN